MLKLLSLLGKNKHKRKKSTSLSESKPHRILAPKTHPTSSVKINRHELYKAWHEKHKNKINRYKQILGSFDKHHVMDKGDEVLKGHRHEDPFTKVKRIIEHYKKN